MSDQWKQPSAEQVDAMEAMGWFYCGNETSAMFFRRIFLDRPISRIHRVEGGWQQRLASAHMEMGGPLSPVFSDPVAVAVYAKIQEANDESSH